MQNNQPAARYGAPAIVLHWLIAITVIGLIAWGWWMQTIPKDPVGPRVDAFNLHKSIGLIVLLLMIVRLAWRSTHPPPAVPPMPPWQAHTARVVHWMLYACLFVQPLSGYLGSAFSGYPVRWFGVVLPPLVAKSVALKDVMSTIHRIDSWVLLLLIVIHVAAAAKHTVIDKNGLIRRMWFSTRSRA